MLQDILTSTQLFDNDGTLIDSTSVINAYWRRLAGEIGIDYETMINTAHGRRSIDTLKIVAPDRANWECTKSCTCTTHSAELTLTYRCKGTRSSSSGKLWSPRKSHSRRARADPSRRQCETPMGYCHLCHRRVVARLAESHEYGSTDSCRHC